jgi:response regulator RpfG family c-di-GMP phosphodiesterase
MWRHDPPNPVLLPRRRDDIAPSGITHNGQPCQDTVHRPLTTFEATMPAPAKHCLLVIDDESDVCDSVHDLLRREFRVLKATSAAEGCRLMLDEEVHIIMTDQRMPNATGVELLAKAKARNPQAIRMLFTGYADLESIIAAINQGHIYQFLKKPWQPEELQNAVRQAALEYDRLAAREEESEQLRHHLTSLLDRVTTLESEVRRLGGQVASVEKGP